MLFVQFYQPSALNKFQLIQGCGDRAVIILDARYNLDTNKSIAEKWCRERGYHAWTIYKGYSILQSKPITQVILLEEYLDKGYSVITE